MLPSLDKVDLADLFMSLSCHIRITKPLYPVSEITPSLHVLGSFQAVYIAPLKALVRERMDDWKVRFQQKLGRRYENTDLFL